MSARSFVVLGAIVLVACQAESSVRPALTREELLKPETCKECHINHYNEWSASMHAYATRDPVFVAMNKRGQQEAQLNDFCLKCHAPMAVLEKQIPDYSDPTSIPAHLQGVTCYFCHNAVGVGEPHNNANILLANDTIMRAALNNPLDPGVHGVLPTRSPYHDRSRRESALLCGTCHDIVTPAPNNTHLERTLSEWEESVQANTEPIQTCQECHMDAENLARPAAPGFPEVATARHNHSHLFPAVDVALTPEQPFQEAMRSAVERCELQQRSVSYVEVREGTGNIQWTPGEPYRFTVLLETQAGHAQPSGAANDRRMWLEVVALKGGQEVWWSGRIQDNEPEEPAVPIASQGDQLCMFRQRFKKANGEPAHMFWDAVGEPGMDSRVLPVPKSNMPGSHTADCPYEMQSIFDAPDKLRIRLRMRPMGFDVLQDLVDSGHLDPSIITKMPTFTMYEREDTFDPDTRLWRHGQPLESDCNEYKCLMDPTSPDCLASQAN